MIVVFPLSVLAATAYGGRLFLPVPNEVKAEPFYRAGALPFSFLAAILGTKQSPLGGLDLPLDPEVMKLFSSDPTMLEQEFPRPDLNPACARLMSQTPVLGPLLAERYLTLNRTDASRPIVNLVPDPALLADLDHAELACVYSLGYAPASVPTGRAYGRVYSVIGNRLFADFGHAFWGGKIFMESFCNGGPVTLCANHASKAPAVYAHTYLAPTPLEATVAELNSGWSDGRGALWIDYRADWDKICPSELERFTDAPQDPFGVVGDETAIFPQPRSSFAMFDNAWPARNLADATRWVGYDANTDTDLYLGRALYAFRNQGFRTVAWFNMKFKRTQLGLPQN